MLQSVTLAAGRGKYPAGVGHAAIPGNKAYPRLCPCARKPQAAQFTAPEQGIARDARAMNRG